MSRGFRTTRAKNSQRLRAFDSTDAMALAVDTNTYLSSYAVAPRAVLSIKKLIRTATVALRVRRSSDNAEMDIGFVGTALDTVSMLAWSGSDSVYVRTVYDQTGNGEDAEQATTTKQPRIVNAGTYDGGIKFDGVDDFLKITSLTCGTPQLACYTKASITLSASTKNFLELGTAYNTSQGFSAYIGSTDRLKVLGYGTNTGSGVDYRSDEGPASSGNKTRTCMFDRSLTGTAEPKVYENGSYVGGFLDTSVEQSGNFSSNDAYIGARTGATTGFNNWTLESMAIYTVDSAAYRLSIEALL